MLYDSIENFAQRVPKFIPMLEDAAPLLLAACTNSADEIEKMDFKNLKLRFNEYDTQPEHLIPFEAHVKHWDLQIVLSGEEHIAHALADTLLETSPYDEKEDITFYFGEGQKFLLGRGMAVLLAPWDAHRPGIRIGEEPSRVKKIVIKIPNPAGLAYYPSLKK